MTTSILSWIKLYTNKAIFLNCCLSVSSMLQKTSHRGFSWGRQQAIFTDHWTTNDLEVAGHKSWTIIYFFLSEIIFREKMVSLSNNDRFDNNKIFLPNIWHFSIIRRSNYVSILFLFILKIHERTLL